MREKTNKILDRITDRFEIQDLLAKYAQGVDRRDWTSVREIFHEDAYDDHGEYKGSVDGFINWVSRRHQDVAQSMHFLGNCLIEFSGEDKALVETYYIAMQRIDAEAEAALTLLLEGGVVRPNGSVDINILGRYIDIVERRQGIWKVARRTVAFEAIRTTPTSTATLNPEWSLAKRDKDDPLYLMRTLAGLT